MAHWLMKSEPGSYSWDDLVRDRRTEWDGVRNPAARLHLKAMKTGDEAFFYHSGDERQIVGIMRIAREAQPDPKDANWVSVAVEPVRPFGPVTLKADQGRAQAGEDGADPPVAFVRSAGARRRVDDDPRHGMSFPAPPGEGLGVGCSTAERTLQRRTPSPCPLPAGERVRLAAHCPLARHCT